MQTELKTQERLPFQASELKQTSKLVCGLAEIAQRHRATLSIYIMPVDGYPANIPGYGIDPHFDQEKVRGYIRGNGFTVTIVNKNLSISDFSAQAAEINRNIKKLVEQSQEGGPT